MTDDLTPECTRCGTHANECDCPECVRLWWEHVMYERST